LPIEQIVDEQSSSRVQAVPFATGPHAPAPALAAVSQFFDWQSSARAHVDPLLCGPQRRSGTSHVPEVQSSSRPQRSPFGRGPQVLPPYWLQAVSAVPQAQTPEVHSTSRRQSVLFDWAPHLFVAVSHVPDMQSVSAPHGLPFATGAAAQTPWTQRSVAQSAPLPQ
jgi:hypothetical protein